jgi:putative ABC transport system substrate-binding protein
MRRRDVIALMSGGASLALPFAAGAQSRIVPVIGFLNSGSQSAFAGLAGAFRQGLGDEGYVEGDNVLIEYRWADGDYARLPALVTDLLQRGVAVLAATGGTPAARAAKAIVQSLPILFVTGTDPVKIGLVASVSRPGGNATGVNVVTTDLVRKRVELLHEVVPDINTIALVLNPGSTSFEYERMLAVESEREETAAAAQNASVKLIVVQATADSDFEPAFASAIKNGARGLLISADPFLTDRRALIIALAARHRLPAIYPWRQYPAAGGLMSYGPSMAEAYRQIGRYAGRILKGAKPADLPVQIPAKFELVLNMTAAQTLGVEISPWLLARADEVIK